MNESPILGSGETRLDVGLWVVSRHTSGLRFLLLSTG
jgi:hypothetical protein